MAAIPDQSHSLSRFRDGEKAFSGGGDGTVDVVAGVSGGNEERFKLRRRQQYPASQHFAEEGAEPFGVACLRRCVVRGRAGREKERKQRPSDVNSARNAGVVES